MAENLDVAFRGIQEAKHQFDRGGLPGAVRTQEAKNLTAPDLEINIIHRASLGPIPEILEDFGQAADRDDDLAVRVRSAPAAAWLWRRKECGVRSGGGERGSHFVNHGSAPFCG